MNTTKTIDLLIETIVEDCKPEKIFLISHFEREENFSHPIQHIENTTKRVARYDVLILLNADRDYEALSAFVESRTSILGKVTALVYPMDSFNQILAYGHPFPKSLLDQDCLIFDAGNIDFESTASIDLESHPYPGKRDYMRAMANAEEFLAACTLHIVRKWNEIAAFNLHQAAAQLYMACLLKATGLKFISDDITRLQRYSYWYAPEMGEILGCSQDTQTHLGQQLQKAFLHARYNPDYEVVDPVLQILLAEVRKLFDLAMRLIKTPTN